MKFDGISLKEHFPETLTKLQVSTAENATCTSFSQQHSVPENQETKICKIKLLTFSSVSHTFHVANSNVNHLVLGKEGIRIFCP